MTLPPVVWRRRWLSAAVTVVFVVGMPLAFGHRGIHMALNLVLPGAGLFGVDTGVAVVFVAATVAAVVLWLRWGADWLVVVVLAVATTISALAVGGSSGGIAAAPASGELPRVRAAHEFPLVLVLVGILSRIGRVLRRLPGVAAVQRRRAARAQGLASLDRLPVVDRCRAVAIAALAARASIVRADAGPRPGVEGGAVDGVDRGAVDAGLAGIAPASLAADDHETLVAAVHRPDVARRARRVGAVARGRFGGDPFRRDHAHARAALALTAQLDAGALEHFAADARRAVGGVPCSEPGWVRPLDAVLAAVALHEAGDDDAPRRLRTLLTTRFPLRRGHRAAWWWTVLGVGGGTCPGWEHAAATGLARAVGAVGTGDWDALRTPALGAAARGTSDPHDERLIAAARVWLAQVDDPAAAAIVARPTVRHDPLAVALDRLAQRLRAEPGALHPSAVRLSHAGPPSDDVASES